MENKKYNLNSGEVLEKLYNKKIEGYSEEELLEAEQRLKIKLPKALRNYYLKYGKLNINTALHEIFVPQDLDFSYNYLIEEAEEDEEELLEEDLKEETDNYLLFWVENQGVWYQGIKAEDLENDNPNVYITTNDDLYEWTLCSNSFDSHILVMIYEQLMDSDFEYKELYGDNLSQIIEERNIDKEKLMSQAINSYLGQVSVYWDEENRELYYFEIRNNNLEKAVVIQEKE